MPADRNLMLDYAILDDLYYTILYFTIIYYNFVPPLPAAADAGGAQPHAPLLRPPVGAGLDLYPYTLILLYVYTTILLL